MAADLHALKNEIDAMGPANRLRVAASLIEHAENASSLRLAETIADGVVMELKAVRLFAKKS